MVQGVYIYWKDVLSKKTHLSGVDNKVKDQITLFNDKDLNCKLVVAPRVKKTNRILTMLPYLHDDPVAWPSMNALNGADYLYMRRPDFVSHEYITWLKQLRSTHPNIKIIYEIPTYPYDGERVGLSDLHARIKDIWNRRKLHDYVDYIADLSGHKEIFGIPTLPITNGVVLSKTPMRTPDHERFSTSVDILCVAYYSKWHGIDRFLRGMHNYYKNAHNPTNIRLHLVGGGERRYISKLKRLTRRYHLKDYVIFHGPIPRNKLGDYYNLGDFAIESLGAHRRKIITYSYSIKSREYLAKGMPFIFSTPIDLGQYEPLSYCFKASEDEEPIDVQALLDYYQTLYRQYDETEVANRLREYAEQWVGLDRALSSVIDYIKSLDD